MSTSFPGSRDSALIVATVDSSRDLSSAHASHSLSAACELETVEREPERYGGSGFVVWGGARDDCGVVITSAKWLFHLLHIKPVVSSQPSSGSNSVLSGIEWRLKDPSTKFYVILEKLPQGTRSNQQQLPSSKENHKLTINSKTHTLALNQYQAINKTLPNSATCSQAMPNGDHSPEKGLMVFKAEISSVHLLTEVYRSLVEQMQTLSHWMCETEERNRQDGRTPSEKEREDTHSLVSVKTLLLPLSCVVLLTLKDYELRGSKSSFCRQE